MLTGMATVRPTRCQVLLALSYSQCVREAAEMGQVEGENERMREGKKVQAWIWRPGSFFSPSVVARDWLIWRLSP